LHRRRYALRVVLHSLKPEVDREVSATFQAAEFLKVTELVS
jgi:hypothetical protein